MGRNLAYVCCSGKQYLDKLLRSECQVYEFKEKIRAFKNLATDRMTWEPVSFVASSWRRALLGRELSPVSAAQRGRQNRASWVARPGPGPPQRERRGGNGWKLRGRDPGKSVLWGCSCRRSVLVAAEPPRRWPGSALPWPNAVSGICLVHLSPELAPSHPVVYSLLLLMSCES